MQAYKYECKSLSTCKYRHVNIHVDVQMCSCKSVPLRDVKMCWPVYLTAHVIASSIRRIATESKIYH